MALTFTIMFIVIIVATILPTKALTWSPETPLTTDPAADFQPKILQANDWKIWVVWHSYRTVNVELFYKTSIDGGLSWSVDTRLTNNPATDGTPAIMQSQNGTIWVFWASDRTGNYDIFYKATSNNGLSWSSEVQLTDDPGKDVAPAALQTADGKIWVVWTSRRTLNDELFYKTSSDNGLTWTNDIQLTFNGAEDRYPSIFQAKNGTIWLTWATNRDGTTNFEIYYKTSSNNGGSWSAETRLTRDSNVDTSPSVTQAKDTTVWILWDSDRNKLPGGISQTDLYYNVYNGVSWSGETRFTTNESDDMQGHITQGKTDLFITWVSDRLGNYDIFFTHAFVPVHDVATTEVKPYASKVYSGNPLKINVTVANEGTYNETFGVSIYRNGTLIGTQTVTDLVPDGSRTLTFIWDTTGVPKGYRYTISATAATVPGELDTADNSLTDGTVHVKIPGDINSDNIVNVYDAILLSTNFTHSASDYPDADINSDGYINVLDAIILISHWGETVP